MFFGSSLGCPVRVVSLSILGLGFSVSKSRCGVLLEVSGDGSLVAFMLFLSGPVHESLGAGRCPRGFAFLCFV